MKDLWNRNDILGILSKEVFMSPCVIHTYSKSSTRDSELLQKTLPPRISLRYFASYVFLFWFAICFAITRLFGYGIFVFFILFLIIWVLPVLFHSIVKWFMSFGSRS